MSNPEDPQLSLRLLEPLQFVSAEWSWRGVNFLWMAETELSNYVLTRYVQIIWLRWPPLFDWDEAFMLIGEN